MSTRPDPANWLEETIVIAIEAGRLILDVYERQFDVSSKDDGSPLTDADRAAHQVIVARLAALTPDIPVLSEESARIEFSERAGWQRFWLTDPLDGTKEFVNRNGEFTVNIALIEDRVPVLGVVYVPVTGVCYLALRGQGAWKQTGGCDRQPIHARRYRGGRATVVASRSHRGEAVDRFLENLKADADGVCRGERIARADATGQSEPRRARQPGAAFALARHPAFYRRRAFSRSGLGGCAPPGTGPSRGWHAACADHWRGTREARLRCKAIRTF